LFSDKLHPALRILTFISCACILLISLYISVQISQPYNIDGITNSMEQRYV